MTADLLTVLNAQLITLGIKSRKSMPNLRVRYDNVADSAELEGTPGVGNLTIDNLRTEIKSQVWRVDGTAAEIALTWPTTQALQRVSFPLHRHGDGSRKSL